MKGSMQKVLQQLDKAMFKKTDTKTTRTIMFIMCIVTVGVELWLLSLMRAGTICRQVGPDRCMAIQSDWHDTIVTIFSACKDLQVRGDIEESLFEITNWKLEYGLKNHSSNSQHC